MWPANHLQTKPHPHFKERKKNRGARGLQKSGDSLKRAKKGHEREDFLERRRSPEVFFLLKHTHRREAKAPERAHSNILPKVRTIRCHQEALDIKAPPSVHLTTKVNVFLFLALQSSGSRPCMWSIEGNEGKCLLANALPDCSSVSPNAITTNETHCPAPQSWP